ncbi:Histone-lysine N-methyltransferase, H3 lysine-36 specific [Elsinoe australis]|uniref:Histone-lysine N-methyltransferase, H3 lysine-36 specific n=1 Tax=Elsinoe australis TaxID=40998 RepID=A0A2P7ZAI7_9PEZI|nr:Histone-lysine N-methyltransferase, H3 lysine-36 specific [Elsinoe australis]
MEDDGLEDGITLASVPAGVVEPDFRKVKSESRPSPSRRSTRPLHSPSDHIQSPSTKTEKQETVGGDITLKMEPGEPPKLSRRTSQKVPARPPPDFSHLPDATPEATSTFQLLQGCSYAAKYLGSTEAPLECDCSEEWDPSTRTNNACGEDSDCINRATKMECDPDCGCGNKCQNQRFQRKQYANVSVIKTEKKGFGLRANTDLNAHDFIFEYIGEVIAEPAFRRRMHQYDEEGIKHFYFMSLIKGEFVDATKKGNLGRFCNHSCNPNCYVDKWVVGEKMRMGIFAERNIKAGEELVFNYNVDRYGADPQPCYCGEPNCVGFIGGKTQTGRATKLSWQIVEALGLEDADDWDTAVAKKPRKRKTGEDDEEYINDMQTRELDFNGVRKVMATLATCKEKWIAVKLLDRIQESNDENIRYQVIRMHGYRILNNVLKTFSNDSNVCLQVCDILSRFPMMTRNKIADAGIEETMTRMAREVEDDELKAQAQSLTDKWATLEMGFRIKKIKRDPNAFVEEKKPERRDNERTRARSRSRSKSPDVPKGPAAPTGPRNNIPQRGPGFNRPPPPFRARPGALPDGWFQAVAANGTTYFYNATGQTTWQRPTQPALAAPPPPPPKAVTDQEVLQNLINNIISKKDQDKPSESSGTATPNVSKEEVKKHRKEESWKSLPIEKQKKYYENNLAKKLVDSDFKKGRVGDPRKKLDEKQIRAIKNYARDFLDKIASRVKAKRKSEAKHGERPENGDEKPLDESALENNKQGKDDDADEDVQLSENEMGDDDDERPSATPGGSEQNSTMPKRPRDGDEAMDETTQDETKRARIDEPPPPPPPPPPSGAPPREDGMEVDTSPQENVTNTNGHADAMDIEGMQQPAFPAGYQPAIDGKSSSTSPMQMATPPTTDSTDQGMERKEQQGMDTKVEASGP